MALQTDRASILCHKVFNPENILSQTERRLQAQISQIAGELGDVRSELTKLHNSH